MEKDLNDKINDTLDGWMEKLNHFQVQFSLGKMEVEDEFEKQKKNIHTYLQELATTSNEIKEIAKEKAEKIKTIVSNCETMLNDTNRK